MNTILWLASVLLALVALAGGISKTFLPLDKLAAVNHGKGGAWVTGASPAFVRTLGVLELLAAVGLVVPPLVDVAPGTVAVTAVCWVALMIGAIVTHARHRESAFVALTTVYLVVAAFVAWGRLGPETFTA